MNYPFVIAMNHDVHALRHANHPYYTRIVGLTNGGVEKPTYGCGWNVLSALGIVPRQYAQDRTNAIVRHHAAGEDDYGLMTGTMIDLIRQRYPGIPPLARRYYKFPTPRVAHDLQQALQDFLLSDPAALRQLQGNFLYSIIKLVINEETGLCHTITIAYELQPDGSFNVFTFDVQIDRYNPLTTLGDYLTTGPGKIYTGVSMICRAVAGGKRKSGKQKRLKKKSMKRGGGEMNDPELYSMNKEDEAMYIDAIEKIENEPQEYKTYPMYNIN